MILVKDVLSPYIVTGTNPIIVMIRQRAMDETFRADMATVRLTDPAVDWICSIVETPNPDYGPHDIITFCEVVSTPELETIYWEVLYSWLQEICKVPYSTISNMILPTIELGPMDAMTGSELRNVINSDVVLDDNVDIDFGDNTYQILPESKIQELLNANICSHFVYTAEKRDCDDFSRIARGWLSMLGYGNCTVGTAWYNAYDVSGGILFGHSILIIVYKSTDGGIKTTYAEPQKKYKIWPTDGMPSGMFMGQAIDNIKSYKIDF